MTRPDEVAEQASAAATPPDKPAVPPAPVTRVERSAIARQQRLRRQRLVLIYGVPFLAAAVVGCAALLW